MWLAQHEAFVENNCGVCRPDCTDGCALLNVHYSQDVAAMIGSVTMIVWRRRPSGDSFGAIVDQVKGNREYDAVYGSRSNELDES